MDIGWTLKGISSHDKHPASILQNEFSSNPQDCAGKFSLVPEPTDALLREAVSRCDLINIDGMGVVWGARLLGHPVPERVAGIDLFFHLLQQAIARNEGVFLLGARETVMHQAVDNLQK